LKLTGSEPAGAAQFLLAAVQSRVNTNSNNILATERSALEEVIQTKKLFLEEE